LISIQKVIYKLKKGICMLDKEPGPCRMTVNATRFYFDYKSKKCLSFQYGGCRGNDNNFLTFDECDSMCDVIKWSSEDELKNELKTEIQLNEQQDKELEKCMLPRDEGLCHESQIKYYFDRTKLECAPFEFSGCGGNNNNYNSLAECKEKCQSMVHLMPQDEKSNNFYFY
jgi:papilin